MCRDRMNGRKSSVLKTAVNTIPTTRLTSPALTSLTSEGGLVTKPRNGRSGRSTSTVNTLGLTIPETLLATADEVIQ
jgi:hypothetical protein